MKPGTQVGHYVIERELSRGGQGAVYEARHRSLGTPVALKVLRDTDPDMRRRFLREARTLARLRHPNLLAVTDMGEVAGVPYMAMELVAGRDLQTELRLTGLFSPARAAEVLASVAETLHYCHEQGIVHRDVKPANVLIEEGSGRIVLVDFGLIRRRQLEQAWVSQDRATLTQAGDVLGTPGYLAPEQIDPATWGEADRRADVYGLGATLYALLTGEPPFVGPTLLTLDAVLTAEPPDPRRLRPDLPRDLAQLCVRCLAKDPTLRPLSAEALAGDLRFAKGEPSTGSGQLSRVVALAAVGLALALGGLLGPSSPSEPLSAAVDRSPEPTPNPSLSPSSAETPTAFVRGVALSLAQLPLTCEAATRGDVDALRALADHLIGQGPEPRRVVSALVQRWRAKSDSRALDELERAARAGSATAAAGLGDVYSKALNVPRDHARAAKWYRVAAEQDQVDGLHRLAMSYVAGWGVEVDVDRAEALYRRAAEQGFGPSANNLGQLLFDTQRYAEARRWLLFAAEKKLPHPAYWLARIHGEGKGVPRDWEQAWSWAKRGGRARHSQCLLYMGQLANQAESLTPVQLNDAKLALRELIRIAPASEVRASAQAELASLERRTP